MMSQKLFSCALFAFAFPCFKSLPNMWNSQQSITWIRLVKVRDFAGGREQHDKYDLTGIDVFSLFVVRWLHSSSMTNDHLKMSSIVPLSAGYWCYWPHLFGTCRTNSDSALHQSAMNPKPQEMFAGGSQELQPKRGNGICGWKAVPVYLGDVQIQAADQNECQLPRSGFGAFRNLR